MYTIKDKEYQIIGIGKYVYQRICLGSKIIWEYATKYYLWKGTQIWKGSETWRY